MQTRDQREQMVEALRKFRASLPIYARNNLKIKPKDPRAPIIPFDFNTAQRYLHMRLEKQKKETGRVRALILKGRQQGISTYVSARFYRRSTLWRGINVYILAHEQKASDTLFGMVDRYHAHNPIAPHVGASNAKELVFDRLDSQYTVGTAGAKAGGRSQQSTLFHGSEVAFWANASDHFAASVQTVPDMPGTEIILETTANGTSGEFYERWQEAEMDEGDYIPIFIPWFWQSEYRRPVPENFELSSEIVEGEMSEQEYMERFELDMEQMVWMRAKIRELRSVSLFNQEYPATAALAFQASDTESYIKGVDVLRARKRDIEGGGPLIMGVDPAGEGGDRFAVALRRGHCVEKVVWRRKIGAPEAVEWLDEIIQKHKPDLVNVDAGGLGHSVIGFLKNRRPEYALLVKAVNFGSKSQSKMAKPNMPGPKLRRDEMWQRSNEWLQLEEGVSIPDIDALQGDAIGPRKKPSHNNDFSLESKDEMRKNGIRSPDLWDAICLTFADLSFIAQWNKPVRTVPFGSTETVSDAPVNYGDFAGDNGWMSG